MSKQWFVLETKPKMERTALREITKLGIEAYLPEYQIERMNRRLRISKISTLCHFPRYEFALLGPGDMAAVRACRGVADILPGFPMAPQPVPAADVEALRAAQAACLFDDTDRARKLRGETVKQTLEAMRKRLADKPGVRIKGGPFMGHTGDVEAVHSLERLTVLISLFGRTTEVHMDVDQVEELAA